MDPKAQALRMLLAAAKKRDVDELAAKVNFASLMSRLGTKDITWHLNLT